MIAYAIQAKWICLLLFFVASFSTLAQSSIGTVTLQNKNIQQFEKSEWNIELTTPFVNSYNPKDIMLDMVLTSPSGQPIVLPCYFDSGDSTNSSWKARLAPREVGKYSYFFRLTTGGKTIETKPATFNANKGSKPGFLHKNDLYTFKFDNGSLFRGIGENIGWESRSYENDKWTYDHLLPTLSKNGANFFRTWMCPWNLPLEVQIVGNTKRYHNSTAYFHPEGIQRMEELLHLVDSLGLYMMLTLDMNSGNWNNNPYNQKNGGPAKTYNEFFSLPAAMEKYKNKLRYVVARWGYSTNIAAWEFFNEIDNGVFTAKDSILIPHSDVAHWHMEMSRYLKDIDPYQHLVTTSISHRDIAGLNSIPYIDFNQKHIYKHTEKIPAIYPDYIQTFGKPYVIGEFGYRWEDANPVYAKEADWDYKRGLWYGMFSPTPILPMSWWWEFFDDQNMTPYFQGVREISDAMLQAGKGAFEQFPVAAKDLHAQGMKCGNQFFIYLLNESDEQQTVAVSFQVAVKTFKVQSFNPDSRKYKPVTAFIVANDQLTLNAMPLDAKSEIVYIISAK